MSLAKRNLLTYLAHKGEAGAGEVACAFGTPDSVAAMALLRLVRQGLATRYRCAARGIYRYQLSDRGQSRLRYLQERLEPAGHGVYLQERGSRN